VSIVNVKIRVLAAGVAVCVLRGGPVSNVAPPLGSSVYAASGLSDLTGVEELKTFFNRDRGRPRLVLLLSPT
jgi:hypothetical protein